MSSLIVWTCHSGQSIIAAKKKHAGIYHTSERILQTTSPFLLKNKPIRINQTSHELFTSSYFPKIHVLRLFEVDAHRVRPVCGLHFHERARNLLVVCPKWQRRQWYEWTTPNRRRHSPCWKLAFTSSPRRHGRERRKKTHENSRICPHNLVFFLFSP